MATKATDPARAARFEAFYRASFRPMAAYVHRRVPGADAPGRGGAHLRRGVAAIRWRLRRRPHDRLWLYAVARRTVSDHFRSGRRRSLCTPA